jgi:predicted nucleic acid-binding protein
MIVVSDASPIIALAACGQLDLLEVLFEKVCIPQAVFDELTIPNKPQAAEITKWANDRIISAKNTAAIAALSLSLDPGESEALSLYWEIAADYVLIDEKRGRIIAARNGIKTIGTIGILLSAKQQGLVSAVKPSLDILMNTGFRVSDTLYRHILERAGEPFSKTSPIQ